MRKYADDMLRGDLSDFARAAQVHKQMFEAGVREMENRVHQAWLRIRKHQERRRRAAKSKDD